MSQNCLHHYADLARLQAQQMTHDLTYSRDIMGMPLESRLTHYALHQGKYLGRLIDFDPRQPRFSFARTITDSYVVMLAMANATSLNLQDELQHTLPFSFTRVKTPRALAEDLLHPQASLAEALTDRSPAVNWPQARRATLAFCRVLSGVAESLALDMNTLVPQRLESRARISLFHPGHGLPATPSGP